MGDLLDTRQLGALILAGAVKSTLVKAHGAKWVIVINESFVYSARGRTREFTQLDTAARYLKGKGIELFEVNTREWENGGNLGRTGDAGTAVVTSP